MVMPRLFACECCGFLSTLGSEFSRLDGRTVDNDCKAKIQSGEEPNTSWWRARGVEPEIRIPSGYLPKDPAP